jgi:hypothetical protein
MTTKHKPETPLPWVRTDSYFPNLADRKGVQLEIAQADARYIEHACNAYPKLVAFAERVLKQSNPNIGCFSDRSIAENLLKELGEL